MLETVDWGASVAGREADYDARFGLVRSRLLGICAGLVGADRAEDAVQDAYLAGRARYDRLRDLQAFEAWVIRIAVNRCMDEHRRDRRLVEISPRTDGRAAPGRDVGLRELVERLPARERTIVVLHYGHGYRLEEIGLLLRLSHTNVRTILSRGRLRLLRGLRESTP